MSLKFYKPLVILVWMFLGGTAVIHAQNFHNGYNVAAGLKVKEVQGGGFVSLNGAVVKTNALGNVVWARESNRNTIDFVENPDGTLLVTGHDAQGIYLVKMSASGNIIWRKKYGSTGQETAGGLALASNGDVLLVGSDPANGSSMSDICVLRLDTAGAVIWSRVLGNNGAGTMNLGLDIIETSTGDILVSGISNRYNSGFQPVMIKLSANGNLIWGNVFINIAGAARTLVEHNNAYYLCGFDSFGINDGYLIKTDTSGTIVWHKQYNNLVIEDVVSVSGGGFMLAGYTPSLGNGGGDGLLISTDSAGAFQWAKTYGTCINEKIHSIARVGSGGYIMSGKRGSNAYMVKTDNLGDGGLPCHETSPTISTTNISSSASVYGTAATGLSGAQINVPMDSLLVGMYSLKCLVDTACFLPAPFFQTCLLDTVNFTSKATSYNGNPLHQWNFGDGTTSTQVNPGHHYTSSGTYTVTLIATWPCSADTFSAVINVTSSLLASQSATICDGATYTLPGGNIVNTSGVYVDTLNSSGGCDSIITTTLSITSTLVYNQSVTICNGSTYTLPGGTIVGLAGVYRDTLTSLGGCDSVVITTLSLAPTALTNYSVTICSGYTYALPSGNLVGTAGVYHDTLQTVSGCDSVIVTHLSVSPVYLMSRTRDLCEGDTFTLPTGVKVSVGGVYYDTLVAVSGCDSIIITNLIEHPIPSTTISEPISISTGESVSLTCGGGVEYMWNTGENTSSIIVTPLETTEYCVVVKNSNGCSDSICTKVQVDELCPGLYVPNAFSPNEDGNNDVYQIKGIDCVKGMRFLIYNRWGERIYETYDKSFTWDGTYMGRPVNVGVFVYQLYVYMKNGDSVTKIGSITLVR